MRLRIRLAAGLVLACAAVACAQDELPASETTWQELTQHGHALQRRGDLREALDTLHRAHGMALALFGDRHHNFAIALRRLGGVHRDLGDLRRAESLYRHSLTVFEGLYGPDHAEVAVALNNVGIVQEELGRYADAERALVRSVGIAEREHVPGGDVLPMVLYNLANLRISMGDYGQAESIYRRCLALHERSAGEGALHMADILSNLAKVREYRGDHEAAASLLLRANDMLENDLGPNHPRMGASLNNLATMWMNRGDLERAEPLLRRAAALLERAVGDSMELAAVLTNLGRVLGGKGQGREALHMHQRSLGILSMRLDAGHPGRGIVHRHLGDLHRDEGELVLAAAHYGEGLATLEQALGPRHPDVQDIVTELAAIAWKRDRMPDALRLIERAAAAQEQNLQLAIAAGHERGKRIHLDSLQTGTDVVLSFHLHAVPGDAAAARLAATTVLRRKGRVLEAVTDAQGLLHRRASPVDRVLLDSLRAVRAERARLMPEALHGTHGAMDAGRLAAARLRDVELERDQQALEAQVSERSAALGDAHPGVDVDQVLVALPRNTALIEWIAYRPFDPHRRNAEERRGPARYAAYVLRSGYDPVGVDLGEAASIDELAGRWRRALSDPLRRDVDALARELGARVFDPIAEHVEGTSRLLLSPDGQLNLLPLAALRDARGRALLERHALNHLGSGRELLSRRVVPPRAPPLLVAAPDFDAPPARTAGGARSDKAVAPPGRGMRSATVPWPFIELPAARAEARAIQRLVPRMAVHLGAAARKTALQSARGPAIVHIATHGFFVGERSDAGRPEDALLRSGLALAGANHPGDSAADGILTALEAASLDLWGTQLVVLSACESGVGSAVAGEGVYSLRRALSMAGSQSQMVSLWKIDDEATRDLMTRYYRRLMRGEDRVEALRRIQLDLMRRKAPFDHPFYWAGFVVAGASGPLRLASAHDR